MISNFLQVWDNKSNAPAPLSKARGLATCVRGYKMILTEDTIKRYRANQGYIYVIHAVGTKRYKIGRSSNPAKRLEQLRQQSVYPLQMVCYYWTPDVFADEKFLHKAFRKIRKHGEWFELIELTDADFDLQEKLLLAKDIQGLKLFNKKHMLSKYGFLVFIELYDSVFSGLAKQLWDSLVRRSFVEKWNYQLFKVGEHESHYYKMFIRSLFYYCTDIPQIKRVYDFVLNEWTQNSLMKDLNKHDLKSEEFKSMLLEPLDVFKANIKREWGKPRLVIEVKPWQIQ